MRFTPSITLLILAATAQANPAANPEPYALADPVAALDVVPILDGGSGLEKRTCTYNGCKCNSRGEQLTVCGNCVWNDGAGFVVTTKRVANHIFECSPKGNCCDYGFAKDCGGASARCIVNK